MIHASLRSYALSLPGAAEEFPWGESVAKVNGKVFVFLGRDEGEEVGFSVKLPHSGPTVLAEPWATPTGYGLGRAGWVSVRLPADGGPDEEQLRAWVRESDRAVAPKRLAAQVPG